MKRYFKTVLAIMLILSLLIGVGCGQKGPDDNSGSAITDSNSSSQSESGKTDFNEKSVGGYVGETVNITLTGDKAANVKSAVSSNTDVAEIISVKDGVITVSVKTTGSSDISLSAEDKAKCTVYGFEKKDSTITAEDDLIKRHGRMDIVTNGLLIENTAAGVEVEFFGTKLTAEITGNEGIMRFGVVQDGVYPAADDTTTVSAGTKTYDIATFDTAGLHRVKILKSTEDSMGSYVISSLTVSNGGFKEVTDDYKLKMLVYGDGGVTGHGNMRDSTEVDAVKKTTETDYYYEYNLKEKQNGLYSFTALAANKLGAEYTAFCRSGMGLCTSVSPSVYLRDTFMCTSPGSSNVYDIREESPDVIIFNIGSVDTWARSSNPVANIKYNKDVFNLALKDFVVMLTSFVPKETPIYFCYGTTRDYGWIEFNTVQEMLSGYGYNLKSIRMITPKGFDHPSVSDHQTNADILANQLKKDLGL